MPKRWQPDDEDDPVRGFWGPFFRTKKGQIYVLCAPQEHIRDGLAAIQVARQFPLPEFVEIKIEPSRPYVVPDDNTIFVGRGALFMGRGLAGLRPPTPVVPGYEKLGSRLEPIEAASCYVFEGEDPRAPVSEENPRVLRNSMSKQKYHSEDQDAMGKQVDFGVIKRFFRSAAENTITLEGIHGLGTMGAAKVATSRAYLEELWQAVTTLHDYDPSLPIEILIQAKFDPRDTGGVFEMNAIEVRPISIVYNKKWIFDLEKRIWIDQEPCDLYVVLQGSEIRFHRPPHTPSLSEPWLDIEIDARTLPSETRRLCHSVLRRRILSSAGRAGSAARERLLERLTASSDLFMMSLHEVTKWRGRRIYRLPEGHAEVRMLRKRFLVHLALCRLLGAEFSCTRERLRKLFPEFLKTPSRDRRDLSTRFSSRIARRLLDGFTPLFEMDTGEGIITKDYLHILHDKKTRSYRLSLHSLTVVLRFRY